MPSCLSVGRSVCPSLHSEFQEVFQSYQTLKIVRASLLECSIVTFKHLIALTALEMVICVSLPVQYEFQEVCITYKASVKQFSIWPKIAKGRS